MAFGSYKTIGAVVKEFQITYTEADFVETLPFEISDYFREDPPSAERNAAPAGVDRRLSPPRLDPRYAP